MPWVTTPSRPACPVCRASGSCWRSTPSPASSTASQPGSSSAVPARRLPTPSRTPTWHSITAVVIGGTSLFGGRGRLVGTAIGALIVQTLQFGLSQMGVDQQWRVLATGILVIVAVAVDQWIRKVKA